MPRNYKHRRIPKNFVSLVPAGQLLTLFSRNHALSRLIMGSLNVRFIDRALDTVYDNRSIQQAITAARFWNEVYFKKSRRYILQSTNLMFINTRHENSKHNVQVRNVKATGRSIEVHGQNGTIDTSTVFRYTIQRYQRTWKCINGPTIIGLPDFHFDTVVKQVQYTAMTYAAAQANGPSKIGTLLYLNGDYWNLLKLIFTYL